MSVQPGVVLLHKAALLQKMLLHPCAGKTLQSILRIRLLSIQKGNRHDLHAVNHLHLGPADRNVVLIGFILRDNHDNNELVRHRAVNFLPLLCAAVLLFNGPQGSCHRARAASDLDIKPPWILLQKGLPDQLRARSHFLHLRYIFHVSDRRNASKVLRRRIIRILSFQVRIDLLIRVDVAIHPFGLRPAFCFDPLLRNSFIMKTGTRIHDSLQLQIIQIEHLMKERIHVIAFSVIGIYCSDLLSVAHFSLHFRSKAVLTDSDPGTQGSCLPFPSDRTPFPYAVHP